MYHTTYEGVGARGEGGGGLGGVKDSIIWTKIRHQRLLVFNFLWKKYSW